MVTAARHAQAVGVGRQVDLHDVGFLVHHMVEETRVRVGEPVVVLLPDMLRRT